MCFKSALTAVRDQVGPGGRTSDLLVRVVLDAGLLLQSDRVVHDLGGAAGVTTRPNIRSRRRRVANTDLHALQVGGGLPGSASHKTTASGPRGAPLIAGHGSRAKPLRSCPHRRDGEHGAPIMCTGTSSADYGMRADPEFGARPGSTSLYTSLSRCPKKHPRRPDPPRTATPRRSGHLRIASDRRHPWRSMLHHAEPRTGQA